MEQELQLWDDTRSQVIQFYLARVFRRGNQNKTKLLYHFRIGQIDPETHTLKPVLEILNRESHLEDWDNLSRNIRDIILARTEHTQFSPREKDITICMERILATPQIETKLTIDGVSYLLQTPEITGHMSLEVKFWTTVDLLKKFQIQLHQILQNRDFRSNVEILPDLEISSLNDEDDDSKDVEDTDEQDTDESDDSDVVKKAKPNTEMMIKVEGSVDADDDSVEVEDWEEEDVDELGGEDNDTNDNDEKPEIEENKKEEEPKEKEEIKEENPKPSEDNEEKAETNNTENETEEKVEEEKPKTKRRGRKPKAEKKENTDDSGNDDEEKPKKRTRAKSTAKKTPAKKATRKPRTTKKSDEVKAEDKHSDDEKPETKDETKGE